MNVELLEKIYKKVNKILMDTNNNYIYMVYG